jgi:hypothetical protein
MATTFSSTATSSFTAEGRASHWPRALCGFPLSILYQVDFTLHISTLNQDDFTPRVSIPISGCFTLQIFTINPISGCFHSTDIHPYIRLLLLFGYPLSVLYQVDYTLRISNLNPISGLFYSADIYSQS